MRAHRRVDKTGRIRLDGNVYETQPGLEGRQMEVRFHPLNLRRVQVFCEGRRYDDAVTVELLHQVSPDVNPRHHRSAPEKPTPPSSYLAHLLDRHQQSKRRLLSPLRFARPEDEGGDGDV